MWDVKQIHRDVAREGHRSLELLLPPGSGTKTDGPGATFPWASCARGGWKANKHPSVGGQTPAFCSSARCSKPLPSLSFPECDTAEGQRPWDGKRDGWIIQIPSFPLPLRAAADHSSLRLQ